MNMTAYVLAWLASLALVASAPPTMAGSANAVAAAEEAADPIALAQLDGFALGLARAEKFSGVLLVAKVRFG